MSLFLLRASPNRKQHGLRVFLLFSTNGISGFSRSFADLSTGAASETMRCLSSLGGVRVNGAHEFRNANLGILRFTHAYECPRFKSRIALTLLAIIKQRSVSCPDGCPLLCEISGWSFDRGSPARLMGAHEADRPSSTTVRAH